MGQMTKPADTSPEAEQVLVEVFRKMPPGQKWLQLGQLFQDARLLHAAGERLRHPGATRKEIHQAWLRINLGFTRTDWIGEPRVDQNRSNLQGVRDVTRVLERLGIPYALGGSLASSVHGIARYTQDADITVEPFPGKEAQVAAAFGPDFYLSLPGIEEAVRQGSSFNIINTSTGFKVDVFVRKDQPFEHAALGRRTALELPDCPEEPIFVHTPEDIILFKLRWYRLGNEMSDRQWADIQGVLKVQAGKLDDAYLDRWAADLGVSDLLARARQESQN
jgi:hypothetical protein